MDYNYVMYKVVDAENNKRFILIKGLMRGGYDLMRGDHISEVRASSIADLVNECAKNNMTPRDEDIITTLKNPVLYCKHGNMSFLVDFSEMRDFYRACKEVTIARNNKNI